MIKPMVFSFCSIGCRYQEWDLVTLAQFQQLNFGFSVVGLPVSVSNWWLCLQILNKENPSLNSIGSQFLILALGSLCSELVGAQNFKILVKVACLVKF